MRLTRVESLREAYNHSIDQRSADDLQVSGEGQNILPLSLNGGVYMDQARILVEVRDRP